MELTDLILQDESRRLREASQSAQAQAQWKAATRLQYPQKVREAFFGEIFARFQIMYEQTDKDAVHLRVETGGEGFPLVALRVQDSQGGFVGIAARNVDCSAVPCTALFITMFKVCPKCGNDILLLPQPQTIAELATFVHDDSALSHFCGDHREA